MPQKPRRRVRRKRKKPNYVLRFLLILLLLITASYFFMQSATFNVKNIVVLGNKEVPSEEVVKLSGLRTGINIFSVKPEPAIAALATNPLIAEARIKNDYPSSLEIQVTERKAVALVPSQNGMMYIDPEGYCIKEKRELSALDLPIITGTVIPAEFPLGKKFASADLAMGIEVVKQLDDDMKKRITEINVKNNYISLYLTDNSEVRIGEPERLKEKLAMFDSIMGEEAKKKDKKAIQYIDVSFEGAPVIKYKENW